jgi:large subunit ribosomal protein L4
MPSTSVYSQAGEVLREIALQDEVFGITPHLAVLHQVVTSQMVNRRQGNASTKTRAFVSGGNSKPYRQKGTGRARQGSTRAPQFRHGGTVFGPKPHPYHHKVMKKMGRLAIRSVLSDKMASGRLIVVDQLSLTAPRTKEMAQILKSLPCAAARQGVLLMLPERNEYVRLSARNLERAKVQHVCSVNVIELLKHEYVILPLKSVRWLEMVFGEGKSAEEAMRLIAEETDDIQKTSAEESSSHPSPSESEPAEEGRE